MTQTRIHFLTTAFTISLLAIIVLADTGTARPLFNLIDSIPGRDKTGHFVLMGMLALLVVLSYPRTVGWRRWRVPAAAIMVAIIVTMEEISQIVLSHRGFSWGDLAADYMGIVLWSCLAVQFMARRTNHSRAST